MIYLILIIILLMIDFNLIAKYYFYNIFDNKKINYYFKIAIDFLKDWKNALCYIIAWMITNGWCYIFIAIGIVTNNDLLRKIGLGYLAFLWIPVVKEQFVTIPIAIFLKKILFKRVKRIDKDFQKC